ncbi:MAG: hypothetical protein NUV31_05430 [Dehalococcoidales bacterium]|jgi:hypothetical protein|nr:hypothetical protein [Dehalococcoidales bacterium]
MKKILIISGTLLIISLLTILFIVPAFAHDTDSTSSENAWWQEMQEAHNKGDWQAMHDLMDKIHGENFDMDEHMEGSNPIMGNQNDCHEAGDASEKNDNENSGSNYPETGGTFEHGMMGGLQSHGGMMGW